MRVIFLSAVILFAVGCGGGPQAERAAAMIEVSTINYDRNMSRICEAFIQDYRTRARQQADVLAENALASITTVVNGQPSANPVNVQVILKQKAAHYAKIEEHCIGMRRKILLAHQDVDHILAYSQALKKYFDQKTSFGALMNETSSTVIEALDAFVGKKGEGR